MTNIIIDLPKRILHAFWGSILFILDFIDDIFDYIYDLSTTSIYTEILSFVLIIIIIRVLILKRKAIFNLFEKLSLILMVGCLLVLYVIHRIAEVFINPFRSVDEEK